MTVYFAQLCITVKINVFFYCYVSSVFNLISADFLGAELTENVVQYFHKSYVI